MASPLALVAGLGNPGTKYDATRHNAGFWFLDEVARRNSGTFRAESRFNGDVTTVNVAGVRLVLVKPATFMNRSGQCVSALARYYKITPEQVLVVHDEIDLPAGTVRFKTGGGPGGHNGLKDIISHFGGDRGFHRLRLGVGHPGQREQVLDYVLKRPSVDDQIAIDVSMDVALGVFEDIARGEFPLAMNVMHTKSDSAAKPAA
jgi:peptidyl-tRNA hydrolase, PTH1 family